MKLSRYLINLYCKVSKVNLFKQRYGVFLLFLRNVGGKKKKCLVELVSSLLPSRLSPTVLICYGIAV